MKRLLFAALIMAAAMPCGVSAAPLYLQHQAAQCAATTSVNVTTQVSETEKARTSLQKAYKSLLDASTFMTDFLPEVLYVKHTTKIGGQAVKEAAECVKKLAAELDNYDLKLNKGESLTAEEAQRIDDIASEMGYVRRYMEVGTYVYDIIINTNAGGSITVDGDKYENLTDYELVFFYPKAFGSFYGVGFPNVGKNAWGDLKVTPNPGYKIGEFRCEDKNGNVIGNYQRAYRLTVTFVPDTDGVQSVKAKRATRGTYTTGGQRVATPTDSDNNLPSGIYIENGKKVVVR